MFGWGKRVVEIKLSKEDYAKLEDSVCNHIWQKFREGGHQLISEWTLLDSLRTTLPKENRFIKSIVDEINGLQLKNKGGSGA